MKWSKEDIADILFFNRSRHLIKSDCESRPEFKKRRFYLQILSSIIQDIRKEFKQDSGILIDINRYDFDLESEDITFEQNEIEDLGYLFKNTPQFSKEELNFLKSKGLDHLKSDNNVFGYHHFRSRSDWSPKWDSILGFSLHPCLERILDNNISHGIIFTLWKNGRLKNVTLRRIAGDFKMKYSQAIPGVDVWNWIDKDCSTLWIGEGLLDALSIRSLGLSSAAISGATWSAWQFLELLDIIKSNDIRKIKYWADNDKAGIRGGLFFKRVMDEIFERIGVDIKIIVLKGKEKDPNDHIKKHGKIKNLIEVQNEDDWEIDKEPFDVTKYLLKRKF